MLTYEYICKENGQTVTVRHGMTQEVKTWGELCSLAEIPVGETAATAPVQRILFGGTLALRSDKGHPLTGSDIRATNDECLAHLLLVVGEERALIKDKMSGEEIKDTFASLDSWEDRYQFIIDLGKELPEMDECHKVEANKIYGCQSQVWMVAALNDGSPATVSFVADSDAHIVRGLIAIVRAVYEGKTPQYILDYNIEQFFEEIQLRQHLSSGRGNGLKEMVKRVKVLAEQFI